jgi:hypothetical protein
MSAIETSEKTNVPESLATITTATRVFESRMDMYNIFCASREKVWAEEFEEDVKVRDLFLRIGKEQAEKAEAELYNKETDGEVLKRVIEDNKEEQAKETSST